MKTKLSCILVTAAILVTPALAAEDLLIYGGDEHKEFLGCLSCNAYSDSSVWNDMSPYGWKNAYGKWNPYGSFKNPYSAHSACNSYAPDPPSIVGRSGNFYGKLSLNEYATASICGRLGNERICQALKAMCDS